MIGRGKTVLVVDPTEAVRQMVAASLRGLKFDRVISVGHADDAQRTLGEVTVDLALVDWDLGERSGFDLAADIRTGRTPSRRSLPIIMMAWKAEPRKVLAAQGLKLNGLLIKPLSSSVIEKKVLAVLDPTPAIVVPPTKPAPKRFLGQPL